MNLTAMLCRCAIGVVIVASATAPRSVSGQDGPLTTAYFEGLLERGLFGVAERYGLDRRGELPVDAPESVQLAALLSRTFARHALVAATADEQAFLRRRAVEALDDYSGTEPYPRIQAVTLERTHRRIDEAELARWSWTADPEDVEARDAAFALLAEAQAALEAWIDAAALEAAKPASSRRPGDYTRRELAVLIHEARLKSIDLLLESAELAETPLERERLVRLAEDRINRAAGSAERGTTAALRADAIRIARLTGDENKLKMLVRQAAADRMPVGVRQEALAELVRHELDQGRHETAARLLVESKESLGESTDRLRALHVESVIGMAANAGAERAKLLEAARSEQATVAGPWRLRNEFLLEEARQIEAYGREAAVLVRRGHREFRAGSRDEAIETFREAAGESTTPRGRGELLFMAASLLVEAGQFSEALNDAERVARDAPSVETAARASLLVAYCRGRIAAGSGNDDDRGRYEASLVGHLERFPGDPTAGDAAWMLQSLAEQEGRLAGIVTAGQSVPEGHPRRFESTARAVQATLKALAELQSTGAQSLDGATVDEWNVHAERLAAMLLAAPGHDLSAARRRLDAARLLMSTSNPNEQSILELLNRIARQDGTAEEREEWQQLAHDAAALKLVCLTGTGRFDEAAATLDQLRSVSIAELLEVLQKLSGSGRQLTGERRGELARLEIATIRRIRLQGGTLAEADLQLLAECEAEALLALGQPVEAARMFDEAMKGKPELAPRLAEALEKSGRPADLERAREIWRQQDAVAKQGTAAWFEARLRLAGVLAALGQTAEARRLVATTRIVYPELGGAALKGRFDDLDRQLRGAPAD